MTPTRVPQPPRQSGRLLLAGASIVAIVLILTLVGPRHAPVEPKAAPEPKPEPKPVAIAAPAPQPTAASASRGCLVFQSSPPGADVELDDRSVGLAKSGGRSKRTVKAGAHTVSMGIGGNMVSTTVEAAPNAKLVVHCTMGGSCTVQASGTCR
ncbi:MAG: hypothetical protein GY898_01690 [Proteobacteria bacterium]|nr:hypothetical protein [Pseudomonadota bacterium]